MAETTLVHPLTLPTPSFIERTAASLVLSRLAVLERGCLELGLPDGSSRRFGDSTSSPHGRLQVHSWQLFPRLVRGSDVGAGESYTAGEWSTPDLVELTRLFLANEQLFDPSPVSGLIGRLRDRCVHLLRRNSRRQARRNIHAHYDLGNDFYRIFLDPTMTYSAALFESPEDTLEQAQHAKYRALADGLALGPSRHVLEIGCGWGGFAELAARDYGCRVTAITISDAQAAAARERIRRASLDNLVDIRVVDYRDIEGRFDAVVSIEMLEAVGHRFLGRFFAASDRLLAPGGSAAIQTITIPDQIYDRYRRTTDWIRKHIFPGGHLPSLQAIQNALARNTSLVVRSATAIGPHYAETLRRWRAAFLEHLDQVRELGFDEAFIRTWDFYLATCQAAFAQRKIDNLQLVLARPGEPTSTQPFAMERSP
jgi:cyclopropane-fatty-acyl-phospholipid synthase